MIEVRKLSVTSVKRESDGCERSFRRSGYQFPETVSAGLLQNMHQTVTVVESYLFQFMNHAPML